MDHDYHEREKAERKSAIAKMEKALRKIHRMTWKTLGSDEKAQIRSIIYDALPPRSRKGLS